MTTAAQLSENSHQGFDGLKAAVCLASMEAKSNPASGMPLRLRPNGIRSRSSGKERDAETGLDYFGARFFSSSQGRFTSPDEPLADQYPEDPQSWNLYAYVRNNPLLGVDPDGRGCLMYITTYTRDEHEQWVATGTEGYFCNMGQVGDQVKETVKQTVQTTVDWITAPRDPGCVAGSAAVGTVAGGYVGGGAGVLVGVGTGGVTALATTPTFSAGGSVAGGVVGSGLGWIMCRKGAGGGGGGSPEGHSSGANRDIDRVAREFKMDPETRRDFGRYVEEVKRTSSRGPADHFSYKELRALAKEFLGQ
jgi:RHS repeat-associated protein